MKKIMCILISVLLVSGVLAQDITSLEKNASLMKLLKDGVVATYYRIDQNPNTTLFRDKHGEYFRQLFVLTKMPALDVENTFPGTIFIITKIDTQFKEYNGIQFVTTEGSFTPEPRDFSERVMLNLIINDAILHEGIVEYLKFTVVPSVDASNDFDLSKKGKLFEIRVARAFNFDEINGEPRRISGSIYKYDNSRIDVTGITIVDNHINGSF